MKKILFPILALVLSLGLVFGGGVASASVTQTLVSGNPDYASLGYDYGYKVGTGGVDAGGMGVNGTWEIVLMPGSIPTGYHVTINTTDGIYFDWTSDLPVDAVIVKGGPNANVYEYDPASSGDTDLHAPINPSNNKPYAISHIDFCFTFELDVAKTAVTSFTRTYEWDIAKSVTPDSWDLFVGDSGTSEYTIAVTKSSPVDSDWAVAGVITIANNTPFAASITSITDSMTGIDVTLGDVPDYTLDPGQRIEISYSAALPDGSSRTNTVEVATDGSGIVGGNSATADVIFGAPTTVVNDSINVDDPNGGTWAFSDSGSVQYSKIFTADDEGENVNTATIRETGQSDNASVTVNVYELGFADVAEIDFTRTYEWTIDKSADQTELTLTTGQQFLVKYTVTVDATYTDSDFVVTGNITITNPAPMDAVINSVSIGGIGEVAVAFDSLPSFPYTLEAGGTLNIAFSMTLPEATTFSIGIVQQNFDYDKDGVATPSGTTDVGGASAVDFGAAEMTAEIDECIDVNDTLQGFLGQVCYNSVTLPYSFPYSRYVGPYEAAGTYYVDNTAAFVTNDTGATGDDDWQVIINIPQSGATLTQGYWKTHSEFGPAPYDETWAELPDGASALFFDSGMTYYQVLWTAPAGDPWYNLAHQYIAAQLNFLNGADPTDAQAAFDAATALFNTYPEPTGKMKGPGKAQFIELATILDDYNNGIIGPGHADE